MSVLTRTQLDALQTVTVDKIVYTKDKNIRICFSSEMTNDNITNLVNICKAENNDDKITFKLTE